VLAFPDLLWARRGSVAASSVLKFEIDAKAGGQTDAKTLHPHVWVAGKSHAQSFNKLNCFSENASVEVRGGSRGTHAHSLLSFYLAQHTRDLFISLLACHGVLRRCRSKGAKRYNYRCNKSNLHELLHRSAKARFAAAFVRQAFFFIEALWGRQGPGTAQTKS
jgi:hypothetical protein